MQIIFKQKDFEVTDAIKDYAVNKLETLSNYVKKSNSILEIEISKDSNAHKNGDHYKVSTQVMINGDKVFIEAKGDDIYGVIDRLKDKVSENVIQREDKKRTKERSLWRRIKDKLKFKNKKEEDDFIFDLGNE